MRDYKLGDKLYVIRPGMPYRINEILECISNVFVQTPFDKRIRVKRISISREIFEHEDEVIEENIGYLNWGTVRVTKLHLVFYK